MKKKNYLKSINSMKISNMIFPALILATLILTTNTLSQVGEQWIKNYSYQSFRPDVMNDMAVDISGNVYITGYSNSASTGNDYGTVKYNSAGVQQWVKCYDGAPHTENDYSNAVATDASGNVYVTGRTSNTGLTGDDITTIKYNSAGVEIWIKVYSMNGNAPEAGNDITVDNSGNVYVTGSAQDGSGNNDVITIKYNSAGTQLWAVKYNSGGANSDRGNTILADVSGNVYVAGTAYSDAVLIKYNSAGVQQWAKIYNGPANGSDNFWNLYVDAAGNCYASGESSAGPNDYDFALAKYNSSGSLLWSKNYAGPGSGDDKIKGLKVDNAGNVYVTGGSKGTGSDKDFATIKYNSAGTQLWAVRYNGPDNLLDESFALTLDDLGNVFVTGSSKGLTTNQDFATVKYNSDGAQQWVVRYDDSSHSVDYGKAIELDASGNLVVSGISYNDYSDSYCTIKYTPLTGIQILGGEIPEDYNLSQNYPNPFNPSTNIDFSIPNAGNVKITIYDITGKVVSEIVNEFMQAGKYKYDYDASKLSSGMYFYRLTSGKYSEVKKMILVK